MKKLFILCCLCFPFGIQAQYTEVINSNRPGFSESPYGVGVGVYQLESTVFYRKIDASPIFSNPKSLGVDFLFRTTFFLERLELIANASFQKDEIAFKNIFESSYDTSGLSKLTLGAKYLIYQPTYKDKSKEIRSWKRKMAFDWKRVIPSIAVYGGANFGNVLSDYHNRGGLTQKAGILLQNEFSKKFNVVTNLYYNYIGSDFPEYSYIITGTYNFTDRWSGFTEHQARFTKYETKTDLGVGAAYLHTKDLQFNISARGIFENGNNGLYGSLGVSYRINRHRDGFIEIDDEGNEIKLSDDDTYKSKNFFGRLLNGFGLFSKKNKYKNPDGYNREKPKRKRKKAVTKKKKNGFLGIFKKKKETKIEKLEREIKELEKDEKKDKRGRRRNKKKNKE